MIHKSRAYQVADVVTAEELAEKLTQHDWCGCQGFRLGGVLFLNDSFSGDGAQEYAVVKDGQQIESITFSWCTEEKARAYIEQCVNGPVTEYGAVTPNLDHGRTCGACA